MERDDYLRSFGSRVEELRLSRGMTQSELAHSMDKDRQVVTRLESGRYNPTYMTIVKLTIALNVSLEEFFKGQ